MGFKCALPADRVHKFIDGIDIRFLCFFKPNLALGVAFKKFSANFFKVRAVLALLGRSYMVTPFF